MVCKRFSGLFVYALCLLVFSASASYAHAQLQNNIIPNEYIVKYKQAPSVAQLQQIKEENGVVGVQAVSALPNTYIYRTDGSVDRITTLQTLNGVEVIEYIEPQRLMLLLTLPNDTEYNKQWGLAKIQMDKAWDVTTGSQQVKIAVIDSGCDASHPDLAGNIVETKVFDDPQFISAHGTHVCGIIGAVGNNTAGVTGTNWRIGIMALKADAIVSGQHGLRISKVAEAIGYATQHGAKVINLSLGGSYSQILKDAVDQATAAGVLVIAAAGNTASQNYNLYPAAWPNVVSVSATGPSDEFASYSSFGKVDVAAPGGNPLQDRNGDGRKTTLDCTPAECIYSTWFEGGSFRYSAMTGTSMAAPHVSGVAGLLLAAKPQVSAAEVRGILENSAVDLGSVGKDVQFGYGRVDAFQALQSAGVVGGGGLTPQPTILQLTVQPSAPQPSSSGQVTHPCFTQSENGDYNCDNSITINDFQSWRQDFLAGIAYASMIAFESIREAMF